MKIITEEILDQAIAAAKQGHLDNLAYKQNSWCGTACCVLGFARHIAGCEEINKGPQDGEIEDTPRAQTIQALMRNRSPEIVDIMAAVRSDGTLPVGLAVGGNLTLCGWASLTALPDGLTVGGNLTLCDCASLTALPDGLTVGGNLTLCDCASLTALPDGLTVGGHLYLYRCTSLISLPRGLKVGGHLYLFGCPATVPSSAKIGGLIYR